jgi:hypothetical protein
LAKKARPFCHRNYPMSAGLNETEDMYAFGGSSNAEFEFSKYSQAAFERWRFSIFAFCGGLR